MQVCVIGAGAAGLVTAKHLLEEGLSVEVLEKRDGLGGLWYFDQATVGVASSTSATTSKTYLQFSDFPMRDDMPFFPHHSEYLAYLHDYAQHFGLFDVLRFEHEVLRVEQTTAGWTVTVQHQGQRSTRSYDAVVVCSGLHHVPLMPDLPGRETYTGTYIHSSLLKDVADLKGKRVVVVGGGESAADLIHELAPDAGDLYLSLRRGMIITRHWYLNNLPADYDSMRAKVWLPRQYLHDLNVDCRLPERYSAFKTLYTLIGLPIFLPMHLVAPETVAPLMQNFLRPETWQALFKPPQRNGPADSVQLAEAVEAFCNEPLPESEEERKKRAWQLKFIFEWYSGGMHNSQPFTKRVAFLSDILTRKARVIPGLTGFAGGTTVTFEGGRTLEADYVVMCTGFRSRLPFMPDPDLDGRSLYRNVFPPGDSSLAYVGFVRPNIGSAPAAAEMQARWVAAVLAGRVALPDKATMQQAIAADAAAYTTARGELAQRLTSLADYHIYMETLARELGVRPNLWAFALQPRLLYKLLFGPFASYQYRFHGPGANPQAARKTADQIQVLPAQVPLTHIPIYFVMKPGFWLLSKLSFRQFKPVF